MGCTESGTTVAAGRACETVSRADARAAARAGRSSASSWLDGEDRELTTVALDKKNGNGAYGLRLVDTEDKEAGLMIMRIPEGGALSKWIQQNPSAGVGLGDRIISANGLTAPWAIMEEMVNSVTVEMVVRRATPGAKALLSQCYFTDQTFKTTALVIKRTVPAGEISMESCAICMEDVQADERVAGLSCGHGFHQRCIARWLARHDGSCGCPLCREAVH